MRRRLPGGGGISLEVRLGEAGNALVVARRIEHAEVELQRLADPLPQLGVVGEIVVGQRMNEGAEA